MKNIIKNVSITIILLLIIIKRPLVINSIIYGISLWSNNIFPSIFPILIISDLILSSNLINIIKNIFGKLFNKLFKVSYFGAYTFIMSLFSGCPSNAKYINDLLKNKMIDKNEAIKLLSMTLLYNPVLIMTLTSFLKKEDSLFLIISNIIINLIIGFINRGYKCEINNSYFKPINFNLVESINNSINTLLLILGTIITFITLSSIIPIKHPLISGILEITNGIYQIGLFNFIYEYKILFCAILMSFGGLSIITQIKSIFKDTSLDYSLFYRSRIIHLILFILAWYFETIYSPSWVIRIIAIIQRYISYIA